MADVTCDPSALVAAAKCFDLDKSVRSQVELFILATIAGMPTDRAGVEAIVKASKCFNIDKSLHDQVELYLLCQAAQ
jgi:hypothetical protein